MAALEPPEIELHRGPFSCRQATTALGSLTFSILLALGSAASPLIAGEEISVTSAERGLDCSGVVPGNVFGDDVVETGLGLFYDVIAFSEAGNGYLSTAGCGQNTEISGAYIGGVVLGLAEVVPGVDQAAWGNAESGLEVEFQAPVDMPYSLTGEFYLEASPGGQFASATQTWIRLRLEGTRPGGGSFVDEVWYYHDDDPPFLTFDFEGEIAANEPVFLSAEVRAFRSVSTLPDFDTPGYAESWIVFDLDLGDGAGGSGSDDSPYRYRTEMTPLELEHESLLFSLAGLSMLDIDIRTDGTSLWYAAIWGPADATIHTLLNGTPAEWTDFHTQMGAKNGRFLDVDVLYINDLTDKRYWAIFLEDGDDYEYALHTTNTDAEFQDRLDQYLDDGYTLVDFEAYNFMDGEDLGIRYAGVWVRHPNQPRTSLFYGLESADLDDLLAPLAGRVIDFERYWSPLHDEYRYAIILAMVPGGEWAHDRDLTESELDAMNTVESDADTHFIDIEVWDSEGTVHYGGVWGDAVKTLHQVPAIAPDPEPEELPSDLLTEITNFEAPGAMAMPLGIIGVYAKNLRTDQSLGYRQDEPIYIASTAKIAIHIKFWLEVQAEHLDILTTTPYTNGADQRDDWYVDDVRTDPWGMNPSDFGLSFELDRFDRAMMDVSDNAATSMLVDHPTLGLAWDDLDLNEWLAGVDGIGQGFFPLTSIHDVDRTIAWQGQVVNFPDDEPYFLVAPWAAEPLWRGNGDQFGDLQTWLDANRPGWMPMGGASFPRWSGTIGHRRYYSMGLNSATPKAVSLLLEGLWERRFLDDTNTQAALDRMTEGTPLDDQFPSSAPVSVYAKGGVKGGASGPRSNAAVLEMGPDAIAVTVLTEDNQRGTTMVDPFVGRIGWAVLRGLGANLTTGDPSASTAEPAMVRRGGDFEVSTVIENVGGGRAHAFDVDFYLSSDAIIGSIYDFKIGTTRVAGLEPYSGATVQAQTRLPPDFLPGSYYVGWMIDTDTTDDTAGEVGEWDDTDNVGLLPEQVTVFIPVIEATSTFNPAKIGDLCGVGAEGASGDVLVYECGGAELQRYASDGTFLGTLPLLGASTTEVDLDFTFGTASIGSTLVPDDSLLFIDGEAAGGAVIQALSAETGDLLAEVTVQGIAEDVVGGTYHPGRDSLFLVLNNSSGSSQDEVREIDPDTGAFLSDFEVPEPFSINYGDVEVCASSGHLFLVGSSNFEIAEVTPDGELVAFHSLPVGVQSLSGIAIRDTAPDEAWVSGVFGDLWKLQGLPCEASSPPLVFSDGFESGDTSAWSSAVD